MHWKEKTWNEMEAEERQKGDELSPTGFKGLEGGTPRRENCRLRRQKNLSPTRGLQ